MSRLVRARRAARIWRLTARNAARFASTKILGARRSAERRAELDRRFALRSAQDVAAELGQMKGAMMKVGQMLGFILEALPPDAQAALATLQADAPPMAPSLAESVFTEDLGAPPSKLLLDWDPVPVAAASIGQVHRAVTRDGRDVAVKIQYPGVAATIGADLDNAHLLYTLISAFALKGLDTEALVAELRARMTEELDYGLELANLRLFAEHYRGHPFIHTPIPVDELCGARVLTTEWMEGISFAEFLERAEPAAAQRAGEIIWRFAQGSIHRLGAFNGDPHPGNYRFGIDGTVQFLDFGMVKRWAPGEWERLSPCLDAILAGDPTSLVTAMVTSGFLPVEHGLDATEVYGYVSTPYRPYLTDRFRFTREFVRDTVSRIADFRGPDAEAVRTLNMPASFVLLDRVVWGVSAILGKLGAEGPWRSMLLGYREGNTRGTPLGDADQAWWDRYHE